MQSLNTQSKKWLSSILVFLIFGILQVIAGEPTTNSIPANLFLTDNGFLFWYRNSGERVVNIKEIEKAQSSPESQPANQDPAGHWGQATNGFQLSLRFEKETFTNGEPIVAVALMRNITNQPQNYFRPIQIVVTKNGKSLERKDKQQINVMEISMFPETTLFPQTQNKYQENLNQIYYLSESGEYIFQAVCRHPEVNSEKVSILIKN